ncbi:hypothetical protein OG285_12485 [Streptomyces sp. NBC_01471]|uniref:hypothetical protein n=1 Tax=Streptomyces sp. NBC_01471 TaxID=2903879 RepID=UPI0032518CDF
MIDYLFGPIEQLPGYSQAVGQATVAIGTAHDVLHDVTLYDVTAWDVRSTTSRPTAS